MNRAIAKRVSKVLAIAAGLAILAGCGSSGNNGGSGLPPGVIPGGSQGMPGGCVPIGAQIPFTGTNVYVDWANIIAGQIPQSYQGVGQMFVGGGGGGGPYSRQGVDGMISMNVMPAQYTQMQPYPGYQPGTVPQSYPYSAPPAGYGGQQTANISGTLQISPQTQQDIINRVLMGQIQLPGVNPYAYGQPGFPQQPGTGYGYPNVQQLAQQICVSQIAMNVGHYYTTIYGGYVYLYLNGTQHGYVLYF